MLPSGGFVKIKWKWFSAKERQYGSLANRSFGDAQLGFGGSWTLIAMFTLLIMPNFWKYNVMENQGVLALSRAL